MKITLDITAQDFDHLTTNMMLWGGTDWKSKNAEYEKRFECLIPQTEIDYGWVFIHWVTTYADYILVAAYLKAIAEPHQALFDSATGDIAILTDFAGSWMK